MNNSKAHQQLLDDILFRFGSESYIRVRNRKVGTAIPLGQKHPIKFGINGETDIDGIVKPWGFYLSIEVKTGSGKLSKDQIIYRDMIIDFGGIYIEARSVEQAWTDFKLELDKKVIRCKNF